MEETKGQTTPRCHTLVLGCCSEGKCTNKEGGCGCGDNCKCPETANCKRTGVRKEPELGGGNGMLWAMVGVVLAAGAAGAAFYVKNKN